MVSNVSEHTDKLNNFAFDWRVRVVHALAQKLLYEMAGICYFIHWTGDAVDTWQRKQHPHSIDSRF